MQRRGTEFGTGRKRNGKTFLLGIQEKPPHSRNRLFRSREMASPLHATFLPTRNSPSKIVLAVSFDRFLENNLFSLMSVHQCKTNAASERTVQRGFKADCYLQESEIKLQGKRNLGHFPQRDSQTQAEVVYLKAFSTQHPYVCALRSQLV